MRAGFILGEVLNGFRRNITMTIAMILTTAISLGLLGGGLIVARMTDQLQEIYGDRVEVTIYLTPDVSAQDPDCRDDVCQAINSSLQANAEVASIEYESQAAAFQRYQQQFAGQPELLEIGTQEALSASFHVRLADPQRFRIIAEQYSGSPGVQSVSDQSAFLDRLFSLLNSVRNATIVIALIQALAALLLISNMVQIAAFTRRTETSIMRLVGASRWRTQLPFMIEAILAGVIGAALAIGGLVAAKFFFIDKALGSVFSAGILPPVDTATLIWVSPILVAIGAGLAAVSAYVTLRLYVRL
ncbi:ABC transporter permease [Nakamurella flavida]|uniref:Cell division protein FtsX n=1 Tax=Nakamurella flavida TaxID=363630 RepID=A0A938YQP3_9ACTN|nr:permease-like cell division protein FtsX [Nakamurella flavida]MBM9477190.1 ABC transporter permease [Nakamurella flavida]MDP9780139.1 cell division transport system permease protein [Nakamurella flavida]